MSLQLRAASVLPMLLALFGLLATAGCPQTINPTDDDDSGSDDDDITFDDDDATADDDDATADDDDATADDDDATADDDDAIHSPARRACGQLWP